LHTPLPQEHHEDELDKLFQRIPRWSEGDAIHQRRREEREGDVIHQRRREEREGKGTNLSKDFNEIKVMNRKSSRE
jgi:hypothetical protein